MSNWYWTNATEDGLTAAAWNRDSPGSGTTGVPAAGDSLFFLSGSTSWRTNLTTTYQGSDALASITVAGGPDGFHGSIGTASASLDAEFTGTIRLAGRGALYKFSGDQGNATEIIIETSIDNVDTVQFSGNVTSVRVKDGRPTFGPDTTIASMIAFGGRPSIEGGCTLTTIDIENGAKVFTESSPVTLNLKSGGYMLNRGSGNITTANIDSSAVLDHRGQGNIATLNLRAGGTLNLTNNPYSITVGTSAFNKYAGSTVIDNTGVGGSYTESNVTNIGGAGATRRPGAPGGNLDDSPPVDSLFV